MNRLRGEPLRALVVAVIVTVAALGARTLSRMGSTARTDTVPKVLALEPSEVHRVVVESKDRQVELTREQDGSWSGAGHATGAAETLMFSFEDRLFPLRAYRALHADASSPEFGLTAPEIAFDVEDTKGVTRQILFGAPTFTDGGVYARRGADSQQIYLVPRRMMDDLRSLVAGQRVDAPNDVPRKVRDFDEKAKADEQKAEVSWWLQQSLDAGTPLPEGLR